MNDAILFASICVYTLAQNCHNRSSTDEDVKRRTAAILILVSRYLTIVVSEKIEQNFILGKRNIFEISLSLL